MYGCLHRRTPPGVRELKLRETSAGGQPNRRTPPGVRELKHPDYMGFGFVGSRTPPGVRELKRQAHYDPEPSLQSHPSRGA